jgi:chemotaxis protein methyltransferase CheR
MILDLHAFKTLIKSRCGLLFDGGDEDKLRHALSERCATLSLACPDYLRALQDNTDEFQELVNLLTINETYFFREPEQIRLLVDRIAPRFLATRGGHAPVRILSAGCSSGEEPYSLAMALSDRYGASVSRLFTFVGGDIDSAVLAKARTARYTDFSFRGVPQETRDRHFDRDHWGYVLKDAVRERVEFHELNLLAESFPPALRDFDVIFFRNVSIYFDTATRKRIQHNLASLMRDDGILVIGTAETLANDLGVLPLVEEDGLFYFVKGRPPLSENASVSHTPFPLPFPFTYPARPAPVTLDALSLPMPVAPSPPVGSVVSVAVVAPSAPSPSLPNVEEIRQQVRDKQYDRALSQLDALLATAPDQTDALLLKAHVSIERRDFDTAELLAQQVLDRDTWSIDALLLLGLATKWRGDRTAAVRHLKQAVYSRHECWPAHYYLADLYRQSGEPELARRAYRSVLQLTASATVDTGIRVLPLELPAGEIRFLCEHQLAKLPLTRTLERQR